MQFEYENELQNKLLEHDKKIEYFNKLGMLFRLLVYLVLFRSGSGAR